MLLTFYKLALCDYTWLKRETFGEKLFQKNFFGYFLLVTKFSDMTFIKYFCVSNVAFTPINIEYTLSTRKKKTCT